MKVLIAFERRVSRARLTLAGRLLLLPERLQQRGFVRRLMALLNIMKAGDPLT